MIFHSGEGENGRITTGSREKVTVFHTIDKVDDICAVANFGKVHLVPYCSRRDPINEDEEDGEEEFYYTEMEIPVDSQEAAPVGWDSEDERDEEEEGEDEKMAPVANISPAILQRRATLGTGLPSAEAMPAPAPPLLADHADMARPPHENPEYFRVVAVATTARGFREVRVAPATVVARSPAVPIAIPVSSLSLAATPTSAPTVSVQDDREIRDCEGRRSISTHTAAGGV